MKRTLFEKLESIDRRKRILILCSTLFLLTAGFVLLYYFPVRGEIQDLQKQIAGIEQRLEQARRRKADLAGFELERQEVEARFREAMQLLPDKREIPSLLRSVNEQGSRAGLVFQLFSPKAERALDFYVEIPVAVEIKGHYGEVVNFFDKVGKMERIINILDVSMHPLAPMSTTLLTRCTLVTYRFKESADEQASQ